MTDRDTGRVVRPTIRCLIDDLQADIDSGTLRAALRTLEVDMAADPTHLLPIPLIDVAHPVLDKANALVAGGTASHERIVAITDRHVVKIKTGDRRGAMWQDEDGTWWLLAAGRRKNDESGDFYREIERFAKDSTRLAPTDADQKYCRLEAAYAQECEEERAAQAQMIGAVLAAAQVPVVGVDVTIFGATITVTITDDGKGLAVLDVAWRFEKFDQQNRFPADVLAMIPGYEDIDAWEFMPAPESGSTTTSWYTYVSTAWVHQLATSAELDELLPANGGGVPVNPTSDGSEHFSHYAKGSVVMLAYTTGVRITGLCGASIVAHRDYERLPICPTCEETLELLRTTRSGGAT